MHVHCYWCNRIVNRSPSALSRISHVFCSLACKNKYEMMKRQAQDTAREMDRVSRELAQEIELVNETYDG